MNKKILIVSPYFPPHTGGLERYAHTVATKMGLEPGWEVVVLTTSENGQTDELLENDSFKIYRLGYRRKIFNTPIALSWFIKVRKIIKIERPDVVNIHTPVPGLGDIVAFLLNKKIPIVVTYHSGSMLKGRFGADILILLYEKFFLPFMLRKAAKIICSSAYVREVFLKKYLYKSTTITPAVDNTIFLPKQKNQDKEMVLLFVAALGKYEQYKGLSVLLQALPEIVRQCPEVTLQVVGDGEMKSEYIEIAEKLGVGKNVVFRGALHGADLVQAYQSSTVFVHPSSNDSSPTVIIEAMAVGLPVVSTFIGGIPDIVSDGVSGHLVTALDPDALASSILDLLLNSQKAQQFAQAGQKLFIERYTWDVRMAQFVELINSLVQPISNRKVKILMVSPYLYPKIGGVERFVYEIAKKLQESGVYDVSFVTANTDTREYVSSSLDGMSVHNLPMRWKLSNSPIDFTTYFWMKKIIRTVKPDIIHAHAPVPFFAEMAALNAKNFKYILTYHSGKLAKGVLFVDIFLWLYEKCVLPLSFLRADALTTVSQSTCLEMLDSYRYKTTVISPGVTISPIDDSVTLTPQTKVVSYVGRIDLSSQWKGINVLMDAFSLILKKDSEIRLQIVGGGDGVDFYKKMAVSLNIQNNVDFRGVLTGVELERAYLDSSVVVLPSLSSAESFGMVLLEAMALGVPVIGSNIGGIKNLIEHNVDGLLVEPNNPSLLADSLEKVLTDESLRQVLKLNARVKANKYTWQNQAGEFDKLYHRLLYAI